MRKNKLNSISGLAEKTRKIGIFKRLMAAFFIVILVPTLIIGFFSIQNLSAQNTIRTTDGARSGLRNLDSSISERIKTFNDISYKLYLDEDLKQLLRKCAELNQLEQKTASEEQQYQENKKAISAILLTAKKQNPDILNLQIVSDKEEYVCASEQEFPGIHISDLEQFRSAPAYKQAMRSGNLPVWLNTIRDRSTYQLDRGSAHLGQYVTHLRAINEPQGSALGVLVLNISLDIFSDLSGSSDLNVREYHTVLLGDQDVVVHLDANRNANVLPLSELEIQKLLSNASEKDSGFQTLNQKDYLVTTINCESTNWTLASILLKRDVQQGLHSLVMTLVLIAVTCLLLSLTMSYLVTISITRPVRKLCTAMKNVEISSDDAGYIDCAKDEVGLLGQDFNRMLKRNQELIHRVYAVELEKKEETLLRKQAELDALQMQINPHFLYNTLDIIRWQMIDEEQKDSKASSMLIRFSNLLKLSTRKSQHLVPLSEEIAHIKAYLQVVEFDLDYTVKLEADLTENALQAKLPKLTLQPLIENAVVHAFSGYTGQAFLWIFAEQTMDDLFLTLQNNGKELSKEELERLNQQLQSPQREREHIGLRNVHDRIRLWFGEQYGLRLSQNEQKLTEIIIHIPHHRTEGEGTDVSDRRG